jgi:hypothetical protein
MPDLKNPLRISGVFLEVESLDSNNPIITLFRCHTLSGTYITLGIMRKLNNSDLNYYINYITDVYSFKSNDYQELAINRIIINYGISSFAREGS